MPTLTTLDIALKKKGFLKKKVQIVRMKEEKRLISGITLSGNLTLAHYFIVFNQLPKVSEKYDRLLLFLGDLHGITQSHDPETLAKRREEFKDYFLACLSSSFERFNKINQKKTQIDLKTEIFVQSKIPEILELTYFFSCNIGVGDLGRMIQFKTKSKTNSNPTTALFTYPILMAADILMFDADVLVGDDQKQHIELTQTIAKKMNNKYAKNLFHDPKIVIFEKQNFRIRDLQNPEQKMSKSSKNPKGIIFLSDSKEDILKKIKSAKTDSLSEIKLDFEKKPGVSNLILIYSFCCDISLEEAEKTLQKKCNNDYLKLKTEVGKKIVEVIQNIQEKIIKNKKQNKLFLDNSLIFVRGMATQKMKTIKKKLGF